MKNLESLFPALAFTTHGSLCLLSEVENFSVIRLSRHLHKYSTEYIKDKVVRLVCYCCYCYYYSTAFLNPTASCAKVSPVAPGFVEGNLATPK